MLPGAVQAVQGKITDSSDSPLVDVHVFNSGDGPSVLTTKTDGQGRFRLEGLRTGRPYVFAEKDGYRFAALRTESGASDVHIKLLRKDGPAAERRPLTQPDPRSIQRQQAMARQALEEIWSSGNVYYTHAFVRLMGRVDLETALQWAGDDAFDAVLARIARAESLLAEGDVDGAFAVLPETRGYDVFRELIKLAERFVESDGELAIRLIEHAKCYTTELDESKQARVQKELNEITARLDKSSQAFATPESVDDAIEAIEAIGDGRYGFESSEEKARALGKLAVAIADRDPERAWSLIDRALHLCVHTVPPWHPEQWDDRPVRAALLALQANKIGYPDMDSVYARVVASRNSVTKSENILMIVLLAPDNPGLARELLASIPIGLRPVRGIHWTLASTLVGDERFPELVQQRLAEAKDEQARDLAFLRILEMLDVLTAAPANRPERIMRNRGGL